MRRKLCVIAYWLRLYRLAHSLSPSVYFWLVAKDAAKQMRPLDKGELSIRSWLR